MTKDEMLAAADSIIGTRSINDMPIDQINRLVTVAQFVTDLCLHEIEKRGELRFHDGSPCIPYYGDLFVETVLTRAPGSPAPKKVSVN